MPPSPPKFPLTLPGRVAAAAELTPPIVLLAPLSPLPPPEPEPELAMSLTGSEQQPFTHLPPPGHTTPSHGSTH
jgi:hypothetical protein